MFENESVKGSASPPRAVVSAPPSELTLSPSLVVVAAPAPRLNYFRKGSELKITLLSLPFAANKGARS